jgi:1A family penicillin-binding protein
MNRQRRPAFRTRPLKSYEKPFYFAREKWQRFRSLNWKKQAAVVGGVIAIFLVVVPPLSYLYFIRDINDKERLMNRNSTGIVIMDRNSEVIHSYGRTANENFVTLDEISDDLEAAVIASEDKNFYEHGGFSFRSIAGAMIANLLNRDMTKYGGSTITQQLIKNNLLTSNKNFLRKYQELSLSIAIERTYSKDEILEMYLNSVYFGEGAFGIEQAAENYFDKTPQELTLAESTMLVGLLPAPSAYSPISGDPELAKQQQQRVLTQMVNNEVLDDNEAEAIYLQNLEFAEGNDSAQEHAHHFTEMVLNELRERYGEETVARSGFKVRTSIDLLHQKEAEQTVSQQIERTRSQGATNGSMVAIDPKTGEIIALVGSADWNNDEFGQVNMAMSPRQPGSSFKPIYYAEAIDKKLITAATVIRDEPKVYGANYRPENYDFRYRGDITVRHALATSLNIPAIEVLQKLGVEEGSEAARKMGISTVTEPEKYGLSLALGTAETRLLEMTNAYAAFANLGSKYAPTSILEIEDKFGKTVYRYRPSAVRVQSPEASYVISSILSDNNARAPTFGSRLNIAGRDVAVKTGTTNDNVDAWTIGYTPSLAVGVWVGDNQHRPMQLGGAAAAGPIWKTTMENILGNSRSDSFPRPSQVSEVYFCGINGSYEEYFLRGTEPSERCQRPDERAREQAEREAEERRLREEEERLRAEEEERERLEEQLEEDSQDESEEEDEPQQGNEDEPEDVPPPPPGGAEPTVPLDVNQRPGQ